MGFKNFLIGHVSTDSFFQSSVNSSINSIIWTRLYEMRDDSRIKGVLLLCILSLSTFVVIRLMMYLIGSVVQTIALFSDILAILGAIISPTLSYLFVKNKSSQKLDEAVNHSILEPLQLRLKRDLSDNQLPRLFRRPFPTWIDYEAGYVVRRSEVDELQNQFQTENIVLLFGQSGAGKTTLATILGFDWLESERVSYVFYCDLNESLLSECEEEIQTLLESIEPKDSALVIVDNLHMNTRLGRDIYQKREIARNRNVSFLLVTRCTTAEFEKELVHLVASIVREEVEGLIPTREHEEPDYKAYVYGGEVKDILGTVILGSVSFGRAVQQILDAFIERKGFDIKDKEAVHRELVKKCKSSLWLFSFVLSALEGFADSQKSLRVKHIREVSICSKFSDYYNQVFNDFLALKKPGLPSFSNQSLTEKMLCINFMGTLSAYSMQEIPVPEALLVEESNLENVQPEKSREFAASFRDYLIRKGEVLSQDIVNYRALKLPHLTLASQFYLCFGEELDWLASRCGDTMLREVLNTGPTTIRGAMTKELGLTLFRHFWKEGLLSQHRQKGTLPPSAHLWLPFGTDIEESLRNSDVVWSLAKVVETSDYGLELVTGYFRQYDSLFAEERFRCAVARALAYSTGWNFQDVSWLHQIDGFLDSASFIAAACDIIRYDYETRPWALENIFRATPNLVHNDKILRAISTIIEDPKGLELVVSLRILHGKESIRKAIGERISSQPIPYDTLEKLLQEGSLLFYNEIRTAVMHAIRNAKRPWDIIQPLFSNKAELLDGYLQSSEMTKALKSRMLDIQYAISRSKYPVAIICSISICPIIAEDPIIISELIRVLKEIDRESLEYGILMQVISSTPEFELSRRLSSHL